MKKIILMILIVMNISCQTTQKHTIIVIDTNASANLSLDKSKTDVNNKKQVITQSTED